MSLRVSFELDEQDLKHFRLIMQDARRVAARIPPEDIVEAAEDLLKAVDGRRVPQFIAERLDKLRLMINMLSDIEWRLPRKDASRVLNALAYFTESEDLIPDHIPGVGFLDDAIMIELVVRELRHEIDAYHDFCAYRDRVRSDKGQLAHVSRDDWLDSRRSELQSRMRRRRTRAADKPGPGLLK